MHEKSPGLVLGYGDEDPLAEIGVYYKISNEEKELVDPFDPDDIDKELYYMPDNKLCLGKVTAKGFEVSKSEDYQAYSKQIARIREFTEKVRAAVEPQ